MVHINETTSSNTFPPSGAPPAAGLASAVRQTFFPFFNGFPSLIASR